MNALIWKKCSNCKQGIPFESMYYVCSVSTCNRERTGLVFCTVDCWDAHVPLMRHKDAWAEERRSPSQGETAQAGGRRIDMAKRTAAGSSGARLGTEEQGLNPPPPKEVLVVASKVKAYIRSRSDMNTAAAVMERLSDHVRRICDEAIASARSHERKTVLDRDIP